MKKGDNPVGIAKKLKVSYSDLIALNHIDDPRKLQIGQKLLSPRSSKVEDHKCESDGKKKKQNEISREKSEAKSIALPERSRKIYGHACFVSRNFGARRRPRVA